MPLLDASNSLLLAGIALAIYFVLRRRPAPGSTVERTPRAGLRPRVENKIQASDRPDELLQWQVEMHDTARQLKAELDSKLSALQALVIMAKREALRLEAAIRRAESLELPEAADSLARLERLGEPAALADLHALGEAAAHVAHRPAMEDPFAGEQTELALANLVAKGLSAQDIARRLNLPLGEVEFRLNLLAR